jgi:diguanylate cyclase (GGDEF)-like protein
VQRAFLHHTAIRLRSLFTVHADNPELVRAQYEAFAKQIPLLYFILTINTLAVTYSFWHLTPVWLGHYFPLSLCCVSALRFVWWVRARNNVVDDATALKALQRTNVLAAVLACMFTAWALSIYPYGDPYTRGQVAFYMALTVIGCIFCLMHLRSAALSVTLIVGAPFIVFFVCQPQTSLKAMAVNLALVSGAMVIILTIYYRDFANLVQSRKSLLLEQAETQALSDENFRVANLDSLTDLPNRRSFFAALEVLHAKAVSQRLSYAIGVVDLDGFKPVNDTYGHTTGDKVLTEAGQRLLEVCCGYTACKVELARLGGDEFGLIVTGDISDERLLALGSALNARIRLPYPVGATHALIASSIGFATYPVGADTPEGVFERADYALYYAKRNHRGQSVLFSIEHEHQIRSDGIIEQALQSADLWTELSLVYQPIVDARTRAVLAFEALARWHSPQLGLVMPDRFIAVAERAGLIRNLTRVLLTKALKDAHDWPENVQVSFNLSVHDISVAEGVLQLITIINQSGLDPRRIEFEVTETSVTHDFAQTHAAVVTLKALGVGISLDDFGTGYSSLSHVHRLPLDKIKIDRSFVADIEDNESSFKIVKSLSVLCQDMGLGCIVEGVETEVQAQILAELGCHTLQGYLFARPMTAEATKAFLGDQATHIPVKATG